MYSIDYPSRPFLFSWHYAQIQRIPDISATYLLPLDLTGLGQEGLTSKCLTDSALEKQPPGGGVEQLQLNLDELLAMWSISVDRPFNTLKLAAQFGKLYPHLAENSIPACHGGFQL